MIVLVSVDFLWATIDLWYMAFLLSVIFVLLGYWRRDDKDSYGHCPIRVLLPFSCACFSSGFNWKYGMWAARSYDTGDTENGH